MLGGDHLANFDQDWPRIIAIVAAGAVVYKTRNVPLSLSAGMGMLWLLLVAT